MFRHLLEHAATQHGFARTHFTSEKYKTSAGTNPVQQVRQCIPMPGTHKQVARVDRYGKGRFIQPKILVVHSVASQWPVR